MRFTSLCTTGIDDALKIKPLTEEEKKQKLAELREKMTEKRARKAAEEAKEVKANELIRRKAGKVRTLLDRAPPSSPTDQSLLTHHQQEASQIKEDLKNKQILKDLEEKRRGSSPPTFPPIFLPFPTFPSHRQAMLL